MTERKQVENAESMTNEQFSVVQLGGSSYGCNEPGGAVMEAMGKPSLIGTPDSNFRRGKRWW